MRVSTDRTLVELFALHVTTLANGSLVNIVVHTAGCIDPGLVLPLVTALGKRREIIGEDTYFIHVKASTSLSIWSVAHHRVDIRIERLH